MLVDRVLVGLGVVVITAGAALGWAGVTEMGQTDRLAEASAAAAEADATIDGPFASAAAPALGTTGLWGTRYWSTPWQSTWGELTGAGLSRAPDSGTDGSGSPDYGPDLSPGRSEPAEVRSSAAGRVLAAGIEPLLAPAKAEGRAAEFTTAYAGVGSQEGEAEAETRPAARTRSLSVTREQRSAADNLRAGAPAQIKASAPSATEIVKRTYAYGPHGTRNEMDVYRTAATLEDAGERLPTVVLVHGGSWVKGSKEHWAAIVKPFVDAGFTTVAVNYRLATDAAWPAQRTDVVRAVQALKDNSALYNVDPDRMVLMGSSAGGQIVASAATWEEAPNLVKGFVSLSGPLDMFKLVAAVGRAQEHLASQVVEQLMRCEPQDCAARYDDATPARHLDPSDAPSLLVASEGDWVSPEGAREFSAASNNVGVPSDFWAIQGDKHGRDMWNAISQRVLDWVASVVRID